MRGMETRASKRTRLTGDTEAEAQSATSGLLDDIVVTHVLSSAYFDDPADLAQLRLVSRGMRHAVAATGRRVEDMDIYESVKIGCVATAKRLLRRRDKSALRSINDFDRACLCAKAAKSGQLELLKWARAYGCQWSVSTCANAAGGRHAEVLQWTRANRCPWDWQTCANAAWGGHLNVLNGQSKTVPRARGIRARTRRGADTSRCCSFCARAGARETRGCARGWRRTPVTSMCSSGRSKTVVRRRCVR